MKNLRLTADNGKTSSWVAVGLWVGVASFGAAALVVGARREVASLSHQLQKQVRGDTYVKRVDTSLVLLPQIHGVTTAVISSCIVRIGN